MTKNKREDLVGIMSLQVWSSWPVSLPEGVDGEVYEERFIFSIMSEENLRLAVEQGVGDWLILFL